MCVDKLSKFRKKFPNLVYAHIGKARLSRVDDYYDVVRIAFAVCRLDDLTNWIEVITIRKSQLLNGLGRVSIQNINCAVRLVIPNCGPRKPPYIVRIEPHNELMNVEPVSHLSFHCHTSLQQNMLLTIRMWISVQSRRMC